MALRQWSEGNTPGSISKHNVWNGPFKLRLFAYPTHPAPDDLVTHSERKFWFLKNGNKFVKRDQAGAVADFTKEGTVLFYAYLDPDDNKKVQSYRGFRVNLTGRPSKEPGLLALGDSEGSLSVYVSWNGDTQTTFWYFTSTEHTVNPLSLWGSIREQVLRLVWKLSLTRLLMSLKRVDLGRSYLFSMGFLRWGRLSSRALFHIILMGGFGEPLATLSYRSYSYSVSSIITTEKPNHSKMRLWCLDVRCIQGAKCIRRMSSGIF